MRYPKFLVHTVINLLIPKSNKSIWESRNQVNVYARHTKLQKPEETILDEIKDRLPGMKMLDIGIGTGRTTLHFAKLVKEYVGIDYSDKMIDRCREILGEQPSTVTIETGDARDLRKYKDGYFDLALFSYNGIDYIDNNDRLKTLREIKRVIKKGGHFIFSTHNFNDIKRLARFRLNKNIIKLISEVYRFLIVRYINRKTLGKLKSRQFAILRFDVSDFRLKVYFVRPHEQIRQLKKTGFTDIRVFGLSDGKELGYSDLNSAEDRWLYYLCSA